MGADPPSVPPPARHAAGDLGPSLILQQAYRSCSARGKSASNLPDWMMGSWQPDGHDPDPDQRPDRDGADHADHDRRASTCCSDRAGASRCARRCRTESWPAPSGSTPSGWTASPSVSAAASPASPAAPSPDRLDRPDRRPALHRRHVPGRGVRRRGQPARHDRLGLHHRPGQSTLEFFLTGSMAKVFVLLADRRILMIRPQGLFAFKVRQVRTSQPRS